MKAQVIKGGWWWLGEERRPGDVLEAPPHLVARWAEDGQVVPLSPEPETARVVPTEAAVQRRTPKRK
jgi:hypothetical protein